jgi:hypothetical protein
VAYNEKFTINSGSLGQLVRSLHEMQVRINEESETDTYKKALYPVLRTLSGDVLTHFTTILQATSEKEQLVKRFNLFGLNGMVKKTRGRFPFVPRLRPTTTYKYANFGDLLKVLKQRCEYITTREVPQRYIDDVEQGVAFTKLRNEVTEFLSFLKTSVDTRWSDAVNQARTAGGQQVQQNLERRSQSHTQRQTRTSSGTEHGETSAETRTHSGTEQRPRTRGGMSRGTMTRGGMTRGTGRGHEQSQRSTRGTMTRGGMSRGTGRGRYQARSI